MHLTRYRDETNKKKKGWVDLKTVSLFPDSPGISEGCLYVNEFGYHSAVPMDTLHTIPSGLMMLIKDAALQYAFLSRSIDVLEDRLRAMPVVRDPGVRNMFFRKFNGGLRGWGKWTGDDHVAVIQQLPYCIGTGPRIISE